MRENQLRFLSLITDGKSDAKALRQMELSKGVANRWKNESSEFRRAYDQVRAAQQKGASEYSPEVYIKENLLPLAIARFEEVLGIEINEGTPPAKITAVISAASKVLQGTGTLVPSEEQSLSISVQVADAISKGIEYVPAWGRTVEGTARILPDAGLEHDDESRPVSVLESES